MMESKLHRTAQTCLWCYAAYADIIESMRSHFAPVALMIAECYIFHPQSQAGGKSTVQFVASLRKLSAHCQFGQPSNNALRDRFVAGLYIGYKKG